MVLELPGGDEVASTVPEDEEELGLTSKNPLQRIDGGLLAVNLGTLGLVAGAEKLDLLGEIVNVPILVGGLAIGVLFAIISIYLLVFGKRATDAELSRITSEKAPHMTRRIMAEGDFDSELTFSNSGIRRPLLVLVLPLIFLITMVNVVGMLWLADQTREAGTKERAYQHCLWGHGGAEKYKEHWLFAKPEGRAAKIACLNYRDPDNKKHYTFKDLEKSRDELRADETNFAIFTNTIIVAFVIFLVGLPFLLWRFAGLQAPDSTPSFLSRLILGKPRADETEKDANRSNRWGVPTTGLVQQTGVIQRYRTAAAVLSLGGFMLGVGLALTNVSAANVAAGIRDSGTVVAASRQTIEGYSSSSDWRMSRSFEARERHTLDESIKRTIEESVSKTSPCTPPDGEPCPTASPTPGPTASPQPIPIKLDIGWRALPPLHFEPIKVAISASDTPHNITIAMPSEVVVKAVVQGAGGGLIPERPTVPFVSPSWTWACSWNKIKQLHECKFAQEPSNPPEASKPVE